MKGGKSKISGMLHSFNADKCKTSLRLAMSRMKLLRNKKEVQVKSMRRDVANLLQSGQDQTARIRVEHIIREEKMISAFEWIELYCEIIVARLPMIESQKNCPIELKEAIASVIFASPRCADVPELADVRKHMAAKFGKDFVNAAIEIRPDSGVNRTVIEKLSANMPDVQTKVKSLSAIAQEHNIEWNAEAFEKESMQQTTNVMLNGTPAGYSTPDVMTMGSSPLYMPYPTEVPQRASSSSSSTPLGSQYDQKISDENSRVEDSRYQSEWNSSQNVTIQNMEFKDAASAAKAAAASAEMASIAAKAAAELAGRGSFSGKHLRTPYEASTQDKKYIVMESMEPVMGEHETTLENKTTEGYQPSGGEAISANLVSSADSRKSSSTVSSRDERNEQKKRVADIPHVSQVNVRTGVQPADAISLGSHAEVVHAPTVVDLELKELDELDELEKLEDEIGTNDLKSHTSSGDKLSSLDKRGDARKDDVPSDSSNYDWTNTWDDHHPSETGVHRPPSAVFDRSDSDNDFRSAFGKHATENLFDPFSSRQSEEHSYFDSHTDRSQGAGMAGSVKGRTSSIFSSVEEEPSKDANLVTRRSPSRHSYDYKPPAFDSYDEPHDVIDFDKPIDHGLHDDAVTSFPDTKSSLQPESKSRKGYDYEDDKYSEPRSSLSVEAGAKEELHSAASSSLFDDIMRYEEMHEKQEKSISGERAREEELWRSPRSSAYNETEGAERQTSPAVKTSPFNDDKAGTGLNFGKLTGGLKHKGYQRPPYTKVADDSQKESLHLSPSNTELPADLDVQQGEVEKYSIFSQSSESLASFDAQTSRPDERNNAGNASRQERSRFSHSFLDPDDEEEPELHRRTALLRGERESKQTSVGRRADFYGVDSSAKAYTEPTSQAEAFGADFSEETAPRQSVSRSSQREVWSRRTAPPSSAGSPQQVLPEAAQSTKTSRDGRTRAEIGIFASDNDEELEPPQAVAPRNQPRENTKSRRTRPVGSEARKPGAVSVTQSEMRDVETEETVRRTKPPGEPGLTDRSKSPLQPMQDAAQPAKLPAIRPAAKATSDESGEASSTPSSALSDEKKPAHVHPKLPDFDSMMAFYDRLRTNRE